MPQPIIMPKLGQMTEESRVVRWLKQEGEAVAQGEPLVEIETDKATMEVESFYDGVLLKILVPEGETVPVMQTIGFVGEPGEEVPAEIPPIKSGPDSPSWPDSPLWPDSPESGEENAATPGKTGEPERVKISPRAAGLALAHGIDVRGINGTGPGGRIIERDILAAMAQGPAQPAMAPPAGTPLSRMRQIIGRRLTQSFTSTPHFYVTVSVDTTALEELRARLKSSSEHVSITDFLVQATAQTLAEFPDCNSSTDGKTVTRHQGIDIGVAVALQEGIVVPVVRDADRLSLSEIATMTKELTEKAKSGKLKPEEMSGSSFSISNMGMLQVESFTAIINPGESAILAVGSATPQPVVVDGSIEIRPMMKVTLSADHRLIDGALAARFLNRIKERLEMAP